MDLKQTRWTTAERGRILYSSRSNNIVMANILLLLIMHNSPAHKVYTRSRFGPVFLKKNESLIYTSWERSSVYNMQNVHQQNQRLLRLTHNGAELKEQHFPPTNSGDKFITRRTETSCSSCCSSVDRCPPTDPSASFLPAAIKWLSLLKFSTTIMTLS